MNLYVQKMKSAENLACQAVDQILTVTQTITFVLVIQAMLENPILKAAKVNRDNFIKRFLSARSPRALLHLTLLFLFFLLGHFPLVAW